MVASRPIAHPFLEMNSKRTQRVPSAAPRSPGRLLILAAALSLSAVWAPGPTAVLAQESDEWSIERFRRDMSLVAGRRIVVSGLAGDVRIRPGEPERLELSAVAQRHRLDAFTPHVALRETAEGILVEPGFLDDEDRPVLDLPESPRRRIDIVIYVPAATEVEVRGERDTVEVKGMEAAVTVETTQGDIVIATSGSVTATTQRGEIRASLQRLDWEGGSRLESLTGDISVLLPAEADLVVRGETFGELTTDFSVEVERRPPSVKKYFTAPIGGPDRELLVVSNRGGIKLSRSPF